jgi:tight adherence protein B
MTAPVFGICLLVAGWIAARGVAVADRDRIRSRLLVAPPAERGRWFRPMGAGALATAVAGAAAAGVGWVVLGPLGLPVGAALPTVVRRWLAARRRGRLEAVVHRQLEDAVVAISSGVRAGLSARLAVREAARDAEPPLSEALSRVLGALELGESLDTALERLLPRVGGDDVDLVVNVLRIHRRTGGDLPALLDRVAEVIGERTSERRHLRAMTAQATASGAVLAGLPVAFIALLSGVGGGGLGAFYRTATGAVLLLVGLGLDALGFLWMRRIVRAVEEVA